MANETQNVTFITGQNNEFIREGNKVLVQLQDGTIEFVDEDTLLIEDAIDNANVDTASTNKENHDIDQKLWTHEAIILLISLVKKYDEKLDKGVKKYIWKKISEEMSNILGKLFTFVQVNTKWKGLVKTYKDIVTHNNTSGKNKKYWQYFDLVHDILYKKPEINPVAICSSSHGLLIKASDGKMIASNTATIKPSTSTASDNSSPSGGVSGVPYESNFFRKRKEKEHGIEKRHAEKMKRLDRFQESFDKMIDVLAKRQKRDEDNL